MKNKIVIALGGNAMGDNNVEQIAAITQATHHITELIKAGNEVVIIHGNGPQVGKIQLAFDTASKEDDNLEPMPLPESIAMSQGYIGYHLQHALTNYLRNESISKTVATILTQALVDVKDPSFENPSKPIGPFYTLEAIQAKGYEHYVEDSGRGYRQVVASPLPVDLLEAQAIKDAMETGHVVICGGGGGIPVIDSEGTFKPVDAVIDKDAAAALLAEQIDADMLIILTGVDQVALNYGTPEEVWLSEITLEELDTYIGQNHFAPGSMLPKVEAAKRFVSNKKGGKAIITSLESAKAAIEGTAGTSVVQ